MKKLITMLAVLFLVGTISSCQKEAEQQAPEVQVEKTVVDTTVVDTVKAETPPPTE